MQVHTARLTIRPLRRADVDDIAIWQPFADPLLARYNLPAAPDKERDRWFAARTGDPTRNEFAIAKASGRLVGRIGLREIEERQNARLGIVIGAEFVDRGYGREALAGFLDWYFGEGGFERLVLDVSAANARAVHLYQRLGFQRVTERYQLVGDEAVVAFLDTPPYADVRQYFKRENDQVWALFYEMELARETWLRREIGGQRSEVGGRESEVGGQRSEAGG